MPVTFQEWEVDLGQRGNGLPSFSLPFLLHLSKEVKSGCPLTCAYVETSLCQVGIAVSAMCTAGMFSMLATQSI